VADAKKPNSERLPIKLIMPRQGTEKRVPGGGSKAVPFRTVDAAYRRGLAEQVSSVNHALSTAAKKTGAMPVRVKLISKASAKSHRPEQLFSQETCPIVGAGRLGELFVKATPQGLANLSHMIETNRSKRVVKELSCIEKIEPISASYRRGGLAAQEVIEKSLRGAQGFVTRVRLFNLGDSDQERIVANFHETCDARQIPVTDDGYSRSSFTFGVECKTAEDVSALSNVVGVRSIAGMPTIRTLRQQMFNTKPLPTLPARTDVTGDVPVVVIVDSGVSSAIPGLESWVVGRESLVAPKYRNSDHGTFVAGLVCWGRDLNPTLPGIDAAPCGVFDLQLIPNEDASKGAVESISEQTFLASLEVALRQHANDYKVWNLSLSTDAVCSLDEFSAFAEELDNLQERFQVSFVLSAGNYIDPPLLDYPRTSAQIDPGRITAPADSVLSVTVGAVSHVDYKTNGPKEHHPSPYSRHGAGPNYVIKPDLVHYGGACSTLADHISGIRSVNGTGSAENLGTSFSTPLVSRTLAQIYHQITPAPSPVLARGLLTHHARDPRTELRVPDGEENYFGFGLPAPVPYCLQCTPYTSTLVFEDALRPGYFLEWDDFPYPPSLKRSGKYFGEVWMTVAFVPTRGSRWGSEYCETHIDAHFGVYRERLARDTGEVTTHFKGLVPPEHKNPGVLYESYQVEKLRKWAPVRTYHGLLDGKGVKGKKWRLMVQLLTRHGIEDEETYKPQPFSLIVTIGDPEKKAPVYDEMARMVLNRFQAQNLSLRTAARVRTRT
jgi:serine protease AprX